jgi:O-antigen/teichoic acid export membrane protein
MPAAFVAMLAGFIIAPHLVKISQLYKSKKIAELKKIVSNIFKVVIISGIMATLLAWLVGAEVLSMIFGVDLLEFDAILTTIVAGGAVYALFTIVSVLLLTMRHLREQVVVFFTTLLLVSTLGIWAVSGLAINGAVLVYAAANIFQLAVLFIIYRRVLNEKQV